MRYSKQRELIKNIVKGTSSHPTADWVYNEAKKKISSISLGTVYRNLNQLSQDGIIKIIYDNNIARYDWNTVSHDHLKCQKCGEITDFQIHTQELQNKVWNQYKFETDNIEINITGTCNKH